MSKEIHTPRHEALRKLMTLEIVVLVLTGIAALYVLPAMEVTVYPVAAVYYIVIMCLLPFLAVAIAYDAWQRHRKR